MITFLTPTFNSEATIGRLLDSLERQSDRHFRHIVLDGESSDRTPAILERHAVNVHSAPPLGIGNAFNQLVGMVDTPYFMFLNSDDFLLEDTFVASVNAALRSGSLYYVVSTVYCDSAGNISRVWRGQIPSPGSRYFGLLPDHGGTVFDTEWHRSRRYREDFRVSVDAEVMLDLTRDRSGGEIGGATVVKLLGGASTDVALSWRKLREDLRSRRFGAFPLWFLSKKLLKARQFFLGSAHFSEAERARLKSLMQA